MLVVTRFFLKTGTVNKTTYFFTELRDNSCSFPHNKKVRLAAIIARLQDASRP